MRAAAGAGAFIAMMQHSRTLSDSRAARRPSPTSANCGRCGAPSSTIVEWIWPRFRPRCASAKSMRGSSMTTIAATPSLTAYSVFRRICTSARRWYYLIPAQGEPLKLNHRVEPRHLNSLPGRQRHYGAWQEMWEQLREMLRPYKRVAMQYSPKNQIMYVSLVDGGTLELVRGFGVEVVSSADLVARFEATVSPEQIATHFEARDAMDRIMEACFQWVGQQIRNGGTHEFAVQQWLGRGFPPRAPRHRRSAHRRGQRKQRESALLADRRQLEADPQGRFPADRHVGEERQARRGLL